MLAIQGLNQYYGGSHILRDIALTVPAGKCTALLGRNGVGKTTLLKSITGRVPIRTGRILLGEGDHQQDIAQQPMHQRARAGIAYVPQGREIFARLTVEENLRMGLANQPAGTPIPNELFDLFPVLKTMLQRRGGDLSGGQQQQLAIARALATQPKLLILDEPTEGIQPSVIKDIGRVIQQLIARGNMTILLVEQYYEFAEALADYYVVMSRGEIIKQGAGNAMQADGVRDLVAI